MNAETKLDKWRSFNCEDCVVWDRSRTNKEEGSCRMITPMLSPVHNPAIEPIDKDWATWPITYGDSDKCWPGFQLSLVLKEEQS